MILFQLIIYIFEETNYTGIRINNSILQTKNIKHIFFSSEKSRSSRKAFFTTFFLMTAAISQGLVVVQIHAERLFHDAIPTVAPTLLSVILAVAVTGSGMVAAFLTDLAGRRVRTLFVLYYPGI